MLFHAEWFELEVSTSDVRAAFMHAVTSEPKFAKPLVEQHAAGWLWLIKKATNGMRTASKDFGDLVADVVKEKKQTHRSTKTPNPKQQSCSTLTTQSWQHPINRQHLCQIASENKAHEVVTLDRPIKYLRKQYLIVHAHGRRRCKVRLPQ